jgi:sugar O-acyltransferase (sialic acid O-acetyltransferase NeuD family)
MLPPSFYKAHFSIGEGSVICSGVSGTVNVTIGKYVNVNLNCTLGHDCVIEDYVNLTPDVNVSGYVRIKEGANIGCGAVLLPDVIIGKRAIVGAGAVVTKDIPDNQVWIGTPAKFLRTIE